MTLKETIENYVPCDEQEVQDRAQMLMLINNFDDVLTRDNLIGHFVASAFVTNKEKTKIVINISYNYRWMDLSRRPC